MHVAKSSQCGTQQEGDASNLYCKLLSCGLRGDVGQEGEEEDEEG